jgi:hypothetical protein
MKFYSNVMEKQCKNEMYIIRRGWGGNIMGHYSPLHASNPQQPVKKQKISAPGADRRKRATARPK